MVSEERLAGYRVAGRVGVVTLDSPGNRNALSRLLLAQLLAALRGAAEDPLVRVVVLGHTGTTFCAGADLKEQEEARARTGRSPGAGALAPILEAILDCPKPVVAEVAGAVRGGGMGLVAACDLAVAAEPATFAFSEVRVGVAPAVIAPAVLSRMAPALASELFLTGRTFSAAEALRAGLLSRVVPASELSREVADLVSELLAGAPQAQAEVKRLLARVPRLDRQEALEQMVALSERLFSAEEAREGISAFKERRPPSWSR
jgi:methylglutaconyl-CoA hydratase